MPSSEFLVADRWPVTSVISHWRSGSKIQNEAFLRQHPLNAIYSAPSMKRRYEVWFVREAIRLKWGIAGVTAGGNAR